MKKSCLISVFWLLFTACLFAENPSLRVHAHRGGAGSMPENTIEAMLHAVDLGANALELDVQISADSQVVVSHDNYMNSLFVRMPDGSEFSKKQEDALQLFFMRYDSIARFDCGTKPYSVFPFQRKLRTHMPLLTTLIDSVEAYSNRMGKTVEYNVEIKSSELKESKGFVPDYKTYTDLTMAALASRKLGHRLIVQSFDTRTLNYLHDRYPTLRISYLIMPKDTSLSANLSKLTFQPEIYAPHFSTMNEELLKRIHQLGMNVAVWTVDEATDVLRMKTLGVDVIISNYPDRVLNPQITNSKENEIN